MSTFKKATYVVLVTLQLVVLSACAPGLKVKTNTEVEVPPNQIQASETMLARR